MCSVSDLDANVVCLQYLPDCDHQVVILCSVLQLGKEGGKLPFPENCVTAHNSGVFVHEFVKVERNK
jgi:hypothetical protein